jgi:4-hydroxy-3-polyprenylbenzoate decarboxylase
MCTVTDAGAIIAPLSPGFYMTPVSIHDLVDFMVGKLVDLVDIDHEMPVRWDPIIG